MCTPARISARSSSRSPTRWSNTTSRGSTNRTPGIRRRRLFGGPVAPAILYQQADSEFKGWYLDNLFGNLWRRQEWEIYAPTRVGQVLRCTARVADRYRRRDRDVVAQEMLVRDEAGQLIARSIHHQSFMAEQTSGAVALRDPASKEGARPGDETPR